MATLGKEIRHPKHTPPRGPLQAKTELFSDPSPFPEWFRRLRQLKGRSAADLSKLANLSAGYVSDLERGKAQPKAATIEALGVALNLSADEFEALRKRGSADRPAKWDVPGLAIWRHLPETLHQISPLPTSPDVLSSADELYAAAVPAIASAFAWLALRRSEPTASQVASLDASVKASLESIPSDENAPADRVARIAVACRILPGVWRTLVFSEPDAAARVSSDLGEWLCEPGGDAFRPGPTLRLAPVSPRNFWLIFGAFVSCDIVRYVFDSLISHYLWVYLNLDRLNKSASFPTHHNPLRPELELLSPSGFAALAREVKPEVNALLASAMSDDQPPALNVWRVLTAMHNLSFAMRLYARRSLGEAVLGMKRTVLGRKLRDLESLILPLREVELHESRPAKPRKARP